MVDGNGGVSAERALQAPSEADPAGILAEVDREILHLVASGRRVPIGGEGESLVAAGLARDEGGFLALTQTGEAALAAQTRAP